MTEHAPISKTDIAIIGPGPVGLMAALACAQETHFSISLFGPCPSSEQLENDTRTTAFMVPSLTLLDHLKVWSTTQNMLLLLNTLG